MMMEHVEISDEQEKEENKYEETLESKNGVYYHFRCGELSKMKSDFEAMVEKGQQMECPKCKLAGRKDNACTHMTCPKCQNKWCYCCGLSEEDCDKDGIGVTIYDHNIGWLYNEKRCPMYLVEIFQVDERWPEDDQECIDRFHGLLTKKLLKKKIEEIGNDNWNFLLEQFDSIKNCGVNILELEDEDVSKPFIERISEEFYQILINDR